MAEVKLQKISKENWRVCVRLKVADDQQNFVATNAVSLAQAAYETNWRPHGVYVDDEMVGFIMFGLEEYQGKDVWDIIRVMTAEDHQGHGYGRQAIEEVLKIMQADPSPATDVYISFLPDNDAARHVYSKLGFVDVGLTPDGSEVLMHLKISK